MLYNLHSYDHVKGPTEEFYAGNIDGFWRDEADGLKFNFGGCNKWGMNVLERGGESERTGEVRIGRDKSYERIRRGHGQSPR